MKRLIIIYVFLFNACISNDNANKQSYKRISIDTSREIKFNLKYILQGSQQKNVDEVLKFIVSQKINDSVIYPSLPLVFDSSIIYHNKKIQVTNMQNPTNLQLHPKQHITIFLSDEMQLLDNNCNIINSRSTYRIFNPNKPRIITDSFFVALTKKNEISIMNFYKKNEIWKCISNSPVGNYFQTKNFLFVSFENNLRKYDLKTGNLLFQTDMPYILHDFECFNDVLYFSPKGKGLFAMNIFNNQILWQVESDNEGCIFINNEILYFNCGKLYAINLQKNKLLWISTIQTDDNEGYVKNELTFLSHYILLKAFTGNDDGAIENPILLDKQTGHIRYVGWSDNFLKNIAIKINSLEDESINFIFPQISENNCLIGIINNDFLCYFGITE